MTDPRDAAYCIEILVCSALRSLADSPYCYASPELYDLDTVREDINYTANVYIYDNQFAVLFYFILLTCSHQSPTASQWQERRWEV